MKFVVSILLFIFISFTSAPTVIMLIKKNSDVSMFYNFNEEELHKEGKIFNVDLRQNIDFVFNNFTPVKKAKIISENLSRHDNASEEIFYPPPELI